MLVGPVAPVKRLSALPIAFLGYAVGWWGIASASGLLGRVLPFLWILTYFGVFWGGWAGIPVLGVGATLGQPLLPERARGPVRAAFVAWLLAWLGVLLALLWLGPPPGFEAAPI